MLSNAVRYCSIIESAPLLDEDEDEVSNTVEYLSYLTCIGVMHVFIRTCRLCIALLLCIMGNSVALYDVSLETPTCHVAVSTHNVVDAPDVRVFRETGRYGRLRCNIVCGGHSVF